MDGRMGVIGFVVAAAMVAGCTSTPLERQEATQESLVELREALAATRAQIENTLASLVTLVNAPPDNLQDAYQQYARNADEIAQHAARVEAESRQVDRRSEAWLAGWQQSYAEIDNPELRSLTASRREQVLSRFDNIEGSLVAARDAFVPFVRNLQDVKQVVGNDLTPNGVAAVSGTAVVRHATENGAAAARALDVTIADLQTLIATLAPTTSRSP